MSNDEINKHRVISSETGENAFKFKKTQFTPNLNIGFTLEDLVQLILSDINPQEKSHLLYAVEFRGNVVDEREERFCV